MEMLGMLALLGVGGAIAYAAFQRPNEAHWAPGAKPQGPTTLHRPSEVPPEFAPNAQAPQAQTPEAQDAWKDINAALNQAQYDRWWGDTVKAVGYASLNPRRARKGTSNTRDYAEMKVSNVTFIRRGKVLTATWNKSTPPTQRDQDRIYGIAEGAGVEHPSSVKVTSWPRPMWTWTIE